MKKLSIFLLFLLIGIVSAQAQEEDAMGPHFKFKDGDTYDFQTIKEGPLATHVFEFTNTGKQPLIIQGVSAGCSCTSPEWPKDPILPGKKNKITVVYNTQGRVGPFVKEIYITSNVPAENGYTIIRIKGTVEAATATKQ